MPSIANIAQEEIPGSPIHEENANNQKKEEVVKPTETKKI